MNAKPRIEIRTTTENTSLPPCSLPDCKGGDHHYHDIGVFPIGAEHDCAQMASLGYRCYGPHVKDQPGTQWQPIEHDQIKAGMRIRATVQWDDRVIAYVGVARHLLRSGGWTTEKHRTLTGWNPPTTYEVDPATLPDPDPDTELIDALREASYLIENSGERPDQLPGLPEARDLLNKLRELGWTVIRESEATA